MELSKVASHSELLEAYSGRAGDDIKDVFLIDVLTGEA